MTHSEFTSVLKLTKRWSEIVYTAAAFTLMLLICGIGYLWFSEIKQWLLVFRDPVKPIGDDGTFGAIAGMLIGIIFLLPSMLLPLIPVMWIHHRFGVNCECCGASLTLWRRGAQVLKSGTCCKCHAPVFPPEQSNERDEVNSTGNQQAN
ncbi:MAG: hypothetical protein KDA78_03985 [Planctomycetaceae bacterium]|nr:hypothetical protein [Planctomycetaceae bacterium]